MSDGRHEMLSIFAAAASDDAIVAARYGVVDAAAESLGQIADQLHVAGCISRSPPLLSCALLSRLASELSAGIALLLRGARTYPAGALLRQLIEVEYLLFRAYADPSELARWYTANAETLRNEFKPAVMRKHSDGLFRDEEYWLHCEVGGHPHPRARMILDAYEGPIAPAAFLLPDCVQHLRRLWTSMRLLLPQLDGGKQALDDRGEPLRLAVDLWENVEDPNIVAFDGIPRTAAADDAE